MMTLSYFGRGAKAVSLDAPKLRVHDVGDFEASFVPRIVDFDRLDERFRIPTDVWDRLPVYHDYGFAVFKLRASAQRGFTGGLGKLFGGIRNGNNRVFLTLLGGGAFGNQGDWIIGGLQRALSLYRHADLDVAIVSYGSSKPYVRDLVHQSNS